MVTEPRARQGIFQKLFPSRALALLLGIGFLDLFATAILHANGLISELNPVMRPLIEHSEWTFGVVKGGTLLVAWLLMVRQCPDNLVFVRRACLVGSGIYVILWSTWFSAAAFF